MLIILKLKILQRHQTQFDAARALGIAESRLSRIVRERTEPTDAERARIIESFGVDALTPVAAQNPRKSRKFADAPETTPEERD